MIIVVKTFDFTGSNSQLDYVRGSNKRSGKTTMCRLFSYGNHGFSTSMLICPGALEYLLTMAMFNGYIRLLGGRNGSVSCAQVSNLWGKWRGAKRDQHVRINIKNIKEYCRFLFVIVGRYRYFFGFNLGH